MFGSYHHHHRDAMLFLNMLCRRYVITAHTRVKATSIWPRWLSSSYQKVASRVKKKKNLVEQGRRAGVYSSEKYDAVHSPRKACCIKGCAAFKHVALVAGIRNTVDSSVLHKKKKRKKKSQRAPEQNLCIETRHFTVSTRGQIHKRTPAKSSQNLYEWREPWSSWNILSLLLHTDWYLHQAAQTYLGYFLWSGKLSRWGWGHYRHRVWWASEAPRGGAEHCH